MEANVLAEKILAVLNEKKAQKVELIPVTEQTTLADYFILASGNSVTQVKALEDEVTYRLKEEDKLLPLGLEGAETGRWILIDYGTVIVHIFHKEDRSFYDLDKLWNGSPGLPKAEE